MKKIISLLCVILILCTCAACSNKTPADNTPGTNTESTDNVRDPQQENAIHTDDLTQFAIKTGALTNYRIAAGYTSNTENIVTVILHDGKDVQSRKVFHNLINPDGSSTMKKQEEFKFVWSENAKYTIKNGEEVKADYTFANTAAETTFAKSVDEVTANGFYQAILENMSTATYDIINDRYTLDSIQLVNGNETLMFDDVYITIQDKHIKIINCTNGVQTITIELTGINNVNFEGE